VASPDVLRYRAPGGELKPKPMNTVQPPSDCAERQNLRVRKQVYELTLGDLSTFPVWEFRLDAEGEEGRDESTVRPYSALGPLDPTDGMFIVRAVFTLADGTRMRGYITPPGRDDAGVGTLQPIVVTDRGQIRFWCGTATPSPKRLTHNYELLGKNAKQVFPVQFESDVELLGGPVKASMSGFLVLKDFQTRRTTTVI